MTLLLGHPLDGIALKQPHLAGELNLAEINVEHGRLGNTASIQVKLNGELWLATEIVFQAMRFDDEAIRAKISYRKPPMSAKMDATRHKFLMVVQPMSDADL